MKIDIERKDGKIRCFIELEKYSYYNQKKQKYFKSSVVTLLEDRGLKPGKCLQNATVHNDGEKALSGTWFFEDLSVPQPEPETEPTIAIPEPTFNSDKLPEQTQPKSRKNKTIKPGPT